MIGIYQTSSDSLREMQRYKWQINESYVARSSIHLTIASKYCECESKLTVARLDTFYKCTINCILCRWFMIWVLLATVRFTHFSVANKCFLIFVISFSLFCCFSLYALIFFPYFCCVCFFFDFVDLSFYRTLKMQILIESQGNINITSIFANEARVPRSI